MECVVCGRKKLFPTEGRIRIRGMDGMSCDHNSDKYICSMGYISSVQVRKTIRCGVVYLTKQKEELLNQEYDNFQHFLQTGEDLGVYSAHKQQAKRFYKVIKEGKEYPISIRNDVLKIEKRDTKITKYWARIPVKGKYGGIWVAIKPHEDFPDEYKVCESKLYRRNGRFYLNVTIEKEVDVELPKENIAVISIDIGEANPIAYTVYADGKILGMGLEGREIRRIRWHYLQRRREIGRKKVKHALRAPVSNTPKGDLLAMQCARGEATDFNRW